MRPTHSNKRIRCCDFLRRHKTRVYKVGNNRFKTLGDLANQLNVKYRTKMFKCSDYVCWHCFRIMKSKVTAGDSDDDPFVCDREKGIKLFIK